MQIIYKAVNISAVFLTCFVFSNLLTAQTAKVSQQPPMGWNSYTSFGASVKESEVLDNAGFMAAHLRSAGWEYIVIGNCWYYPYPAALNNLSQRHDFTPWLNMDKYGRLMPDADRFPSAKREKGFTKLAEQIHAQGLKFGIQIMRGIPRQAVACNTRIKGTKYHAKDIADTTSTCTWLNHMYGINMSKPGAQEYYTSLLKLYASWKVDYILVDDISYPVSEEEITAIRKAIEKCGRPMVLSLAPGQTSPAKQELFKEYADTWRISDDFRDNWKSLEHMFTLLHTWESAIGPGHFPDADILNIGLLSQRGPLGEAHQSGLTRNELVTMMTLWSISRSPLMYGGDLSMIRSFELQLISNPAVIKVNQNSANNRQLFRKDDQLAWIAGVPGSNDKYLAVFNLGESSQLIHINLKDLGFQGRCTIKDLWTGDELGRIQEGFRPEVLSHGARLFRISE